MTRLSRTFSLLPAGIFIVVVVAFQSEVAAQNPVARTTKYATEYNWSVTPSEDLAQPGNRIVNLPSCPPGVKGREPEYWVLIGGSGANRSVPPEPAKVTGGTCDGDGVLALSNSRPRGRILRVTQFPARRMDYKRR